MSIWMTDHTRCVDFAVLRYNKGTNTLHDWCSINIALQCSGFRDDFIHQNNTFQKMGVLTAQKRLLTKLCVVYLITTIQFMFSCSSVSATGRTSLAAPWLKADVFIQADVDPLNAAEKEEASFTHRHCYAKCWTVQSVDPEHIRAVLMLKYFEYWETEICWFIFFFNLNFLALSSTAVFF